MAEDKVTRALVEALKEARAAEGEQRLFRGGKLAGLFATRHGAAGDAAALALRDGLLEVVRTEAKGKVPTEWVRPTPRAVEFLHRHESPLVLLRELREALRTTGQGVPAWLDGLRQELHAAGERLAEEARRYLKRLEALGERVEEALRRLEAAPPGPADGDVPWAADALGYLDRRRGGGTPGECPLPELFEAVTAAHAGLSLPDFHAGLRRLHDRRALRLLPFAGPADQLPRPEYALLDGGTLLYYAWR